MEEEGRKKKRMRRCREKKRKEDGRKNWNPRGNIVISCISGFIKGEIGISCVQ